MRIPFIAGNWKMNTTAAEAERLVLELIEVLIKVFHNVLMIQV